MYFPEANCPFYRVTYLSNYSPYMTPDNKTHYSLLCETSYSEFKPVDGTRIVDDIHRTSLIEANRAAPAVLIDGFVAATWRIETKGSHTALTVRPFARIGARDRSDVQEEGERLAAFLAPESTKRRVVFAGAG